MRKLLIYRLSVACLLLFLSAFSSSALTTEIYTYRGKESASDTRGDYGTALFRLALDKTVATHGDYQLQFSTKMNTERALKALRNNQLPNFFAKQSVSKERLEQLGYIDFPVDLGIVGYRVFFVSPFALSRLQQVQTLAQLKTFSIGQGIGWLDGEILKHNGFNVIYGSPYESLFKMVSKGRFDLFARGSNELLKEYRAHANIDNLIYDHRLVLYYPLPRFFFTNKANTAAIDRIKSGLLAAYHDGSLIKLWEQYYGESIAFVTLQKRKIFTLENPFIADIDSDYEKYIYHPK